MLRTVYLGIACKFKPIQNAIYSNIYTNPPYNEYYGMRRSSRGTIVRHAQITINGHHLHYVTVGEPTNPPLFLIHGYLSSHHVWRQTIPALQDQYYCIAVDLFGHGRSAIDPKGDYSIPAQAQRILALANELGFDRFSLVGHSMGGQIAMYIAACLAPERVVRLVDVAGVVGARLTTYIEHKVFPLVEMVSRVSVVSVLAEVLQRVTVPRFRWAANLQFSYWFRDITALDFSSWRVDREQASVPGIRHTWTGGREAIYGTDVTPHLSKIRVPTLVIFGKQDSVVPVKDGLLADQHIPDSKLVLIDQCGHFPMFEQTDEYLDALQAFLF